MSQKGKLIPTVFLPRSLIDPKNFKKKNEEKKQDSTSSPKKKFSVKSLVRAVARSGGCRVQKQEPHNCKGTHVCLTHANEFCDGCTCPKCQSFWDLRASGVPEESLLDLAPESFLIEKQREKNERDKKKVAAHLREYGIPEKNIFDYQSSLLKKELSKEDEAIEKRIIEYSRDVVLSPDYYPIPERFYRKHFPEEYEEEDRRKQQQREDDWNLEFGSTDIEDN